MLDIKMNISEFVRDIQYWKHNLHRVAGKRLGELIMREYERLVNETPQWSGTTAASWSIGFSPAGGVVDLTNEVPWNDSKAKKSRRAVAGGAGDQEPRHKGHARAVQFGLARADLSLLTSNLEQYAYRDIVLTNDAPGFEASEAGGGLRDVNKPGGMLARFEAALASAVIDLNAEVF